VLIIVEADLSACFYSGELIGINAAGSKNYYI
jgi:hypothetical protein